MSNRTWIYTGLGLAAGVGLVVSISDSSKSPRSTIGGRILLIGDSLAQALSGPLRSITKENGLDFRADGRQGTRVDQWITMPWLAADLSFRPTTILVSLGTNDMKLTDPSFEPFARFASMLRTTGTTTIWIAPPTMPFPDHGVRFLIDKTGLPVFRSESLEIPRDPDGIHPTAAGAAGWAGAIWGRLRAGTQGFGGNLQPWHFGQRSRAPRRR